MKLWRRLNVIFFTGQKKKLSSVCVFVVLLHNKSFVSYSHMMLHNTIMYIKTFSHPIFLFPFFLLQTFGHDFSTVRFLFLPHRRNGSHQPWGSLARKTTPPWGAALRGSWDGEGTVCSSQFLLPERQTFLFSFLDFIALSPPSAVSPTHTVNGYWTHLNANANCFSPYQVRTMQSELNIHRHYDSRWQASDSREQASMNIVYKLD